MFTYWLYPFNSTYLFLNLSGLWVGKAPFRLCLRLWRDGPAQVWAMAWGAQAERSQATVQPWMPQGRGEGGGRHECPGSNRRPLKFSGAGGNQLWQQYRGTKGKTKMRRKARDREFQARRQHVHSEGNRKAWHIFGKRQESVLSRYGAEWRAVVEDQWEKAGRVWLQADKSACDLESHAEPWTSLSWRVCEESHL